MIRSTIHSFLGFLIITLFISCSEPRDEKQVTALESYVTDMNPDSSDWDPFQITMNAVSFPGKYPLLQSFASATYGNYWILIGGRKDGLHSLDNDPPAFARRTANDSLWLIDIDNQTVQGVGVPPIYRNFLSGTNMQDFQVGDVLYLCGGFTSENPDSLTLDWTSDRFFQISVPNLVQYIQSGGVSPSLDQVFPVVIQSPYVQVTGGEMIVVNNHVYLVGGQNYEGPYIPGHSGKYTNAIRKFDISIVNGVPAITDTMSLIDPIHLHRRDLIMVPAIFPDPDSVRAIIYGGVFTPDEMAFRSPIYISGLTTGQPAIIPDTNILQNGNLYTCALIATGLKSFYSWMNHYNFLGGISYMLYDSTTQSLTVPQGNLTLPFSNLITSIWSPGSVYSMEAIQLPPDAMLPSYLGSNAQFFPNPNLLMKGGAPDMMDLALIFPDNSTGPVAIGYMYGGIWSRHPTTTSPGGTHGTYVNPDIYEVFMSMKGEN